jgi:hypothetical protein
MSKLGYLKVTVWDPKYRFAALYRQNIGRGDRIGGIRLQSLNVVQSPHTINGSIQILLKVTPGMEVSGSEARKRDRVSLTRHPGLLLKVDTQPQSGTGNSDREIKYSTTSVLPIPRSKSS